MSTDAEQERFIKDSVESENVELKPKLRQNPEEDFEHLETHRQTLHLLRPVFPRHILVVGIGDGTDAVVSSVIVRIFIVVVFVIVFAIVSKSG